MVRQVTWRTRAGKIRRIRLYECWLNMRGRLRGGKSRHRGKWLGLDHGFSGWADFRAWALSSGYRRGMQLDRIDPTRGYFKDNLRWLPAVEHSRKSARTPHELGCHCGRCVRRRDAMLTGVAA